MAERPDKSAAHMSELLARSTVERSAPATRWWIPSAAGLVIVLAGAAAYYNSIQRPFIFDDPGSIERNPTIRSLWPIWAPLSPPGGGEAVQNRPVVNLSLAVNYAIGRLDVRGYHVFNLVIHILAALTLFAVIRRTLHLPIMPEHVVRASLPLAFVASLIWTVHPLNTEAVTYIIQRTESMMGLFYLLTLYCLIRAAASSRPARWYIAAIVVCAMGAGCKETIASAPVVILIYDRVFLARSFKEVFRRRWLLYIALAATWGLLAALVVPGGGRVTLLGAEFSWALSNYALMQIAAVAHYLRLCFWPHPLIVDYGALPFEGATLSIWPATVMLIVLAATVWALCRRPRLGFLGVWFFGILAPSSTIVPLLIQPVAEKRMYLPLAAVVVAVVVCAYILGRRLLDRPGVARTLRPTFAIAGVGLTAAVVVILGFLTVRRNYDYRSSFSVWDDTIAKKPSNWRAWHNRGRAYSKMGSHDKAISDFTRGIRLNPRHAKAHGNRGVSYGQQGDLDKAIHDFNRSIELEGNDPDAYYNRGLTHGRMDNLDKAIRDFTRAIELEPNDAQVHNHRGLTHSKKGNYDAAIRDFTRAIELEPGYVQARNHRGLAHDQKGDYDKAIHDYTRVIEINPNSAPAHNNRGLAHRKKGHFDKAFRDFNRAIELDPDYAEAHNNRGFAHAQNRDLDKAISDFSRAIELDPDYARACYNRAATYGNKGDTDNAIRDYTRAIELDPAYATAYSGRSIAYYHKRRYDRAWADVRKAQALGAEVAPRFLAALRKASPPAP